MIYPGFDRDVDGRVLLGILPVVVPFGTLPSPQGSPAAWLAADM